MRLSSGEIAEVLGNYDIGEFRDIARLRSGYANTNFRLTTDRGDFLLRICREKSEDNILYEMRILKLLAKMDFPAAYPIPKKNGSYVCRLNSQRITLYRYIEGAEPGLNTVTVTEIAKAAAVLNSYEDWRKVQKENAITIDLCRGLIRKFASAPHQYPDIFDFFMNETEYLYDPLKEVVPVGLVHGDIFPDNTIFDGDRLVAIIDFEEVCTDNLLFDVGVTVNGFCFVDNRLRGDLLDTFLENYHSVRPISMREYELLPFYIRWGAFAMIYWHLKNLLMEKDPRKLERILFFLERLRHLEY